MNLEKPTIEQLQDIKDSNGGFYDPNYPMIVARRESRQIMEDI